jgi:hypothetical protein
MPDTETLIETIRTYLTISIGQVSLGPLATAILIITLAAAALSAFYLWRIGQQEDRRDRLIALRGVAADRVVRERGPRWYERIGGVVAASPAIGKAEQERLLEVLAAAGIRRHSSLSGFVASKLCASLIWTALVWLVLEWAQLYGGSVAVWLVMIVETGPAPSNSPGGAISCRPADPRDAGAGECCAWRRS